MAPSPTLASLLTFELRDESGVACLYCRLADSESAVAGAVVARAIARRLIPANERLHSVWTTHVTEGGRPSAADEEVLVASLLQNVGRPENPKPVEHLYGLVAEELWLEVIAIRDLGLGIPIRVEGHDWSATDPGGDGLTVHSVAPAAFCFRLWESKYHGRPDPIRETVNAACKQVGARALSYLARFSMIAQRLTDDTQLASFYGRLPELWADKDPAAGASIVVTANTADEGGTFHAVPSYFEFGAEHHQGQLNVVEGFADFALRVRDMLWKGCGLWNEQ